MSIHTINRPICCSLELIRRQRCSFRFSHPCFRSIDSDHNLQQELPWIQHVTPEVEAVSQYPTILWICGSLTLFMLLVVGLRTYVRVARVKNFGMDDTLVLGGAVSVHSLLHRERVN